MKLIRMTYSGKLRKNSLNSQRTLLHLIAADMKFGSWINNLFHGIECDMENDLNKYLGLRVRSLRENAQMTQEELANVCDVSWRTISNLERGCVTPDLVMICKISKKFNVGLDDLLNIEVQRRKSMSRIATENLLIERIKTIDDPTLDFVVEQLNVVFKYFGA